MSKGKGWGCEQSEICRDCIILEAGEKEGKWIFVEKARERGGGGAGDASTKQHEERGGWEVGGGDRGSLHDLWKTFAGGEKGRSEIGIYTTERSYERTGGKKKEERKIGERLFLMGSKRWSSVIWR